MARRIVERRVHQHGIDTVGRQVICRKRLRIRGDVEHDRLGGDRVRRRIGARQLRQFRIDLDQAEPDPSDATRQRQPGRADAGAEIDHAVACVGLGRRRQQYGVVPGAMAAPLLLQLQLPAEKGVLGDICDDVNHRRAVRG